MKMIKYFSILVIILGFNFSEFTNPETGWSFDQSTSQAFYMFETIQVMDEVVVGDGCAAQECSSCFCCQDENFNSCDVMGAFFDHDSNELTEAICVGWVYLDSSGWTTVPVNGNDGGSYSENYPSAGEQVRFTLYDASENIQIDFYATCQPELNNPNLPADCSFANFGMFLYGEDDYTLDNNMEIPDEFELLNVYPNPFNPSLSIDFFIDMYAQVNISVYDLLGNLIQTLIYNDMYVPGNHSIHWEPSNISSGEYLISLTINGNFIKTKKIIYLK